MCPSWDKSAFLDLIAFITCTLSPSTIKSKNPISTANCRALRHTSASTSKLSLTQALLADIAPMTSPFSFCVMTHMLEHPKSEKMAASKLSLNLEFSGGCPHFRCLLWLAKLAAPMLGCILLSNPLPSCSVVLVPLAFLHEWLSFFDSIWAKLEPKIAQIHLDDLATLQAIGESLIEILPNFFKNSLQTI